MFDYIQFVKDTVYSRTVFFFFPKKLKTLKENREKLEEKIRKFVNKYINEVNPEWQEKRVLDIDEKGQKREAQDEKTEMSFTSASSGNTSAKDSLSFLEKRASRRKTSRIMNDEINMLENIDKNIGYFKYNEVDEEKVNEKSAEDKKNE